MFTAIVFLKNNNVVKYRNITNLERFLKFINKKDFTSFNLYDKKTKDFIKQYKPEGY